MNTTQESDAASTADARLTAYLSRAGEPDWHLNPRRLAGRLGLDLREMLEALARAISDGRVEMHWEVFCPGCNLSVEEFGKFKDASHEAFCAPCDYKFDTHLDRDVRVTFSATERTKRERGGGVGDGGTNEPALPEDSDYPPTRGLDLLLVPAFRELFAGDPPAPDESLRIGRVAMLFTDLRGSTAMYAERGDPVAYRLVRDHFAILGEAIERNGGALIKTIGDAVMASFASGADAVRTAFESQTELHARAEALGGELILKAGVHAGACLSVMLNNRPDFFGGAVNTAARVQGLSKGDDCIVTEEVLADLSLGISHPVPPFHVVERFDAALRGLPAPIRVHRLKQVMGEAPMDGELT